MAPVPEYTSNQRAAGPARFGSPGPIYDQALGMYAKLAGEGSADAKQRNDTIRATRMAVDKDERAINFSLSLQTVIQRTNELKVSEDGQQRLADPEDQEAYFREQSQLLLEHYGNMPKADEAVQGQLHSSLLGSMAQGLATLRRVQHERNVREIVDKANANEEKALIAGDEIGYTRSQEELVLVGAQTDAMRDEKLKDWANNSALAQAQAALDHIEVTDMPLSEQQEGLDRVEDYLDALLQTRVNLTKDQRTLALRLTDRVVAFGKQTKAHLKDAFDASTGQAALTWDKKLQAWDDPASKPEDRLTFADIDKLNMPGFEAAFGNDIIAHKELWRKLLEKKLDDRTEGPTAATTDILTQANRLISNVRAGTTAEGGMSLQEAITEYNKIAEQIPHTDNKSFIAKLFAAKEASKDPVKKRMADMFEGRKKQLRDAIQKQPNWFDPDDTNEILEEFANQAVNDFEDKYGGLDWEDKSELDDEVDRLTMKYSPSNEALKIISKNKDVLRAKTYAEQQKKLRDMYDMLRKTGPSIYADRLLQEMINLGFANLDGTPSSTKGKDPDRSAALKNIRERIGR